MLGAHDDESSSESPLAILTDAATVAVRYAGKGLHVLLREGDTDFTVCVWSPGRGIEHRVRSYGFTSPKLRRAALRRATYGMVRFAVGLENPVEPTLPGRISELGGVYKQAFACSEMKRCA